MGEAKIGRSTTFVRLVFADDFVQRFMLQIIGSRQSWDGFGTCRANLVPILELVAVDRESAMRNELGQKMYCVEGCFWQRNRPR